MKYFQPGGEISKKEARVIGIIGAVLLAVIWYLVTMTGEVISPGILPNPVKVIKSIPVLFEKYHLLDNIWYTVSLNLSGYILAVLFALPLGFAIGMIPMFNSLFRKYFEALRYLPLPTVSGIFISIFGLAFGMKAFFLAFGIFIFALPSVIGKVLDLQNPANVKDNVYLQTAKTMGMSNWQTFKYVYFPYVMEKVYDDIRSLVAISYTYVVIAESLNKVGGIGAMISTFTRQSRTPEVYALLFIIVMIGLLQDRAFQWMKPVLFPHTKK
ncbi:MAG: ABC transporter permease subunit [Prevotella sp.]|nr:ABC transporter permease subunit [Prevotella sp.]